LNEALKVLVVDDSRISRSMNRKLVEALGHEVIAEAVDGMDGIKKFEESAPDLILTDLEMPKLNGLDMIKKIRESGSSVKIVAISSIVNAQVIHKVMKLDAAIVKKPIKEEKFTATIMQLKG